jgi:hypothetical protein
MAPAATAASSPASTEKAAKNIVTENIPELAEDILHIAGMAATAVAANACMPKPVVLRSLVGITQYFLGFCGFLEFVFSGFIPGIPVWVKLHGHFAVRLLDLFSRRIL